MSLKTRKSSEQQGFQYNKYRLSPMQYVRYGVEGIALCSLVAYVFYRSIPAFLILLPFGFAYPLIKREELKEARLEKLALEFKDGILTLSSFLSAGYSVENAFDASIRELILLYGKEGMITREFLLIGSQIRLNRSVEQALMEFADRSNLDDVRNFAEVFAASKRSGGDLVSVISHTAGVIRDKTEVRQQILTMTASRQFEQKVMNMIPFFIVLYIDFTSPGFFESMYTTEIGRILMTICLAVYGAAWAISKRILKIEV